MNSLGKRLWHTDYTFKETPGMYSLLSARVIPDDGGETQFADLRAAYDALPDRMKHRLDGLTAEHSLLYSRGTLGYGLQKLVGLFPEVGIIRCRGTMHRGAQDLAQLLATRG